VLVKTKKFKMFITYRSLRWKIKKDNPIYPHKFRYTPRIFFTFEGEKIPGYEISMDKSVWSNRNSYILIKYFAQNKESEKKLFT
jgi:hypothetical protein